MTKTQLKHLLTNRDELLKDLSIIMWPIGHPKKNFHWDTRILHTCIWDCPSNSGISGNPTLVSWLGILQMLLQLENMCCNAAFTNMSYYITILYAHEKKMIKQILLLIYLMTHAVPQITQCWMRRKCWKMSCKKMCTQQVMDKFEIPSSTCLKGL